MLYELSVVVSQSHVFTLTFFNPEFPWPSNSVSFRKIFLFHINSVEVDTCPLGNFQVIKIIFTSILIFFILISFHFIYLNSPAKIIQTCFAQHFLAINRLKIRQWSQLAKAQSLGVWWALPSRCGSLCSVTFTLRLNHLTKHFPEWIPIIKSCMTLQAV